MNAETRLFFSPFYIPRRLPSNSRRPVFMVWCNATIYNQLLSFYIENCIFLGDLVPIWNLIYLFWGGKGDNCNRFHIYSSDNGLKKKCSFRTQTRWAVFKHQSSPPTLQPFFPSFHSLFYYYHHHRYLPAERRELSNALMPFRRAKKGNVSVFGEKIIEMKNSLLCR